MLRFLAVILAATVFQANAETPFSSLEEQMSGEEFRRAGLEKLSPAELSVLNQWLRSRSTVKRADPSPRAAETEPDERGFENRPQERTAIVTQLVGEFTGWSGRTRFELANGQVWRQARPGTFRAVGRTAPQVRIEPKAFGSWSMLVDGTGRSLRVERIK